MTIDDIKSDTVMELTSDLERLFQLAGCDPMCHACRGDIEIGMQFRLASCVGKHDDNEYRDVMLCDTCTVDDLLAAEAKAHAAWKKRGGGFSRSSRP